MLTDNSPSILTSQKGVENLPMMMVASHVRENILTEEEAKNLGLTVNKHKHYHGLGKPLFLSVVGGLDDVTEAYRGTKNAENPDRRENYFLLISQYKDANGDTINVPVYVNQYGRYNRVFIETNKIATVFGRENFKTYIQKEISKGNLVRIKNRSTQASESTSLIDGDYSKNASKGSIHDSAEDVNKKISNTDSAGRELSKGQKERLGRGADANSSENLEIEGNEDYNGNESYSLKDASEESTKTNDILIDDVPDKREYISGMTITKSKMNTFPPYNNSKSDANEWSTRWAHREDIESGAQNLVFYYKRCYVIEKFDSADLKYQIVGRIGYKSYERIRKELKNDARIREEQPKKKMADFLRERNERGDTDEGRGESLDNPSTKHGRENRNILRLGREQDGKRPIQSDNSRSAEYDGKDRQTQSINKRKNFSLKEEETKAIDNVGVQVDEINREYKHLYNEKTVDKEFLNSVNVEIENAILSIRNNKWEDVPDTIEVTKLGNETIKTISGFVGFDVSRYVCKVEKDALRHIEKRHGINGENDQSLSDPKDIARMGYVINNIDNIEWVTDEKGNVVRSKKYNNKDNTSSPVMSLSSRIDGTYCVSQVVPDTRRKTIWVSSARIEKADGGNQVPNGNNVTPQRTPETPLDSSSANYNVSQERKSVNMMNEKGINHVGTLVDEPGKTLSLKDSVDVSPKKTTEYLDAVEDVQKGKKGAAERLAKYVDEGMIRTEAYEQLVEKYGAVPKGEKPHRDVSVPTKTEKNKKVSQTVRTILEAKATPDELVPTVEKMVEDGVFSYDVYTDKEAIEKAVDKLKNEGWIDAYNSWMKKVEQGVVSKELTAQGWALYNNAANRAAEATDETAKRDATQTALSILDAKPCIFNRVDY